MAAKMLRVWAIEEQVKKAIANGACFMLVCYDVWDRLKGDDDLGYYYPAFATATEVRAFLNKVQLGADTNSGSVDVCEAVVDLSRARERWDVSLCEAPGSWLARMNRMN